MFHFLIKPGSGNKRFGRDTAPIQANAAEGILFDNGNFGSFQRCAYGGRITTRPGADYGYIVLFDGSAPF
jgi:hypothetical protein